MADILNTHHGLCYLRVSDIALDEQDRFWLRRSARFKTDVPLGLARKIPNWVPVSGFSHGGEVHAYSEAAWEKVQVIPEPDPAEWVRVYRMGE